MSYGFVALLLALVLSGLTWVLVTPALIEEGTAAALSRTAVDAGRIDSRLSNGASLTPSLVAEVSSPPSTAAALLREGDRWYSSGRAVDPAQLPSGLVDAAAAGRSVTREVEVGGTGYLAVAMPVFGRSAVLVELHDLAVTRRSARMLAGGLAVASVVAVLLGVAAGRSASALALRPLSRLTRAAEQVASGHLGVRLEHADDPDLRTLAGSFNRTVAALEQRVAADARFATDVSHELRTPLMTMVNSMELVRDRSDSLPASAREPLDLLAEEIERFQQLVTDLLEIARHQAGDQLVVQRLVLSDLVRRTADATAGRPVTTVEDGARGLVIGVDQRRIERVVANLVRNAETHGGGCTRVTVGSTPTGARITVEDSGPGVPPDLEERIFERFSRGPGATSSGVGLGLAIALRHVELHGGSVAVTRGEGGGARFVVDLPFDPPTHDARR